MCIDHLNKNSKYCQTTNFVWADYATRIQQLRSPLCNVFPLISAVALKVITDALGDGDEMANYSQTCWFSSDVPPFHGQKV